MIDRQGLVLILECESREADQRGPRTCRLLANVSASDRDDYWLAEVDPPFIGQQFGLAAEDITEVIVATRYRGQSLFDMHSRTIAVYIARILDRRVVATKTLEPGQTELILWGEVRHAESAEFDDASPPHEG